MDMIMMELNFKDYDIVSYYVNIIKSLVNHAKGDSLFLFYNQRNYYFPLLYRIIDFYNHPEGLVRTTTQNCVIGFLDSKHQKKKHLEKIEF